MDDVLEQLVRAAATNAPLAERHRAFGEVVTHFQDMAWGCAYALLGDVHLAEDAAQDAFICAWHNLPALREPAAFPGWLRQIVQTQCRRQTRRKRVETLSLDEAATFPGASPHALAERNEQAALVRAAVRALPPTERLVTVLFYVNQYSRSEIAAFTGLSTVAVKKRLAHARVRLRERMLERMQDDLQEQRPSRDDVFATQVMAFTKLFSALIDQGVSLTGALNALAERETNVTLRNAITQIKVEVEQGNILSRAMARFPQFFSPAYLAVIHEGEVAGALEVALQRLVTQQEETPPAP